MKEELKIHSIRLTDEMWEYLRVRAFETRVSRAEYVKNLVEKDMEAENDKVNQD